MTKPTIGRTVHYHPSANDAIHRGRDKPLAAIVTTVWSDTCVNLTVFDGNGTPHGRTSVLLHQEGNPRPAEFFAEWPPRV